MKTLIALLAALATVSVAAQEESQPLVGVGVEIKECGEVKAVEYASPTSLSIWTRDQKDFDQAVKSFERWKELGGTVLVVELVAQCVKA